MGVLGATLDEVEEEFEIDMNDEEPAFLKGVSSKWVQGCYI